MSNKSHGGNTVSIVLKIAEPIAKQLGLDIWDVQFVKEGTQWFLRVFIDKKDGVTIEDCEAMSKALDKPLDDYAPISQSYCLEVSSPGVERKLTKPKHFELFKGESVLVKTIRPLDNGLKEFTAILKNFNNGVIQLTLEDDCDISLDKENLVYIKLNDFIN